MTKTLKLTVTFTEVACGECGGIYALAARYYEQQRVNGGFWNCPYCRCRWGFSKKASELELAKADAKWQSSMLANERARHDQTRASLVGHKAAKTRLKNRIARGICPCCKRHFTNLQRHMDCKHPEFNEAT